MSTRKCPKGYHLRRSFTRKYKNNVAASGYTVRRKGKLYKVRPTQKSIHVGAQCVRGIKSKSTVRFGSLRKGDLIKYGYQYRLSDRIRHMALEKAIKAYGALSVFHKLDAVTKLTKHDAPNAHLIFEMDRDWVRAHHM